MRRVLTFVALAWLAACSSDGGETDDTDVGGDTDVEDTDVAPQDHVLTEAWRPESGEIIDCHGGSIRAAVPPSGTDSDGNPLARLIGTSSSVARWLARAASSVGLVS